MNKITIDSFSRSFNEKQIIAYKHKENKKWQWIVLLCCLLFQMFPFCISSNLIGALLPRDWAEWTNNNQTIMSITFTLGALASGLIGPFIARLFGKQIHTRLIYIIGVVAAMVGFFCFSLNAFIPKVKRTIPVVATILYSGDIIVQMGLMIFSGLGINNLISKWWPNEKRGFALGIAYTGGSIGNIWMQQLLQQLAIKFGNNGNLNDDGCGLRWVTYLILALMGLTVGVTCAIIATRRPLPPDHIFSPIATKNQSIKLNATLEASPLVTKKYPPYWILFIGLFILELASIHASLNGQFIANGTAYANNIDANSLIANGMTVFGVFCLIGNATGGMINQKFGPWKSITYAGILQTVALSLLLYSVKIPNLVYGYYALSGISIYIFTSYPPYVCGKLYGVKQSNNHMAILGIFLAIGYAIVNSIIGPIVGSAETHTILFGQTVRTNLLGFGIFTMVTLILGILTIAICCFIIEKKGIAGIIEYSPTKFTVVLDLKYGSKIAYYSKYSHKFINAVKQNKLFKNNKYMKTNEYLWLDKITKILSQEYHNQLSTNEIKLLALMYFYQYTTSSHIKHYEKELNLLKEKNLINIKNTPINNIITLNPTIKTIISTQNKIIKNNNQLLAKLDHWEQTRIKKIHHLETKLTKLMQTQINENLANKYLIAGEKLAYKINSKINNLKNKNYKNEYYYFEDEYYLLLEKQKSEYLKNKLVIDKENQIRLLKKKIDVINFVCLYESIVEIHGYNYFADLLNNEYLFIKEKIIHNINIKLDEKLNKIDIKLSHL